MTTREKAIHLVEIYGKPLAHKVAEELLERDRKWIEKLSVEDPERWQASDITKSALLFEELRIEIDKV